MIELTGDAVVNRSTIQAVLDRGVLVELPAGRWPVAGGLVLRDGAGLVGQPDTELSRTHPGPEPFLHVIGSGVTIRSVTLGVPATAAGPHEGDGRTAVTIGRYLYPSLATWIGDIALDGVRIRRAGRCAANSIAIMGAVRDVSLTDIDISGGGTGVAVHWGAVARSVAAITGPSYHPHRLHISGLRVTKAFEAFYLSSVHDVSVVGVVCDEVEIGFRLLPGDNGVRFCDPATAARVSSHLHIHDVDITWHGLYGIRVAGWGRSEVDRELTRLNYRDVSISACRLRVDGQSDRRRAAVVVEQAHGVALTDVISTGHLPEAIADGRELPLSELALELARR